MSRNWVLVALTTAALVAALPAQAGTWSATRTLERPFAASSVPSPPLAAVNGNGHALLAWNATGTVRYAERVKGGAWQRPGPVPGGSTGAGPVALAIGNNEVAAIAYTTAPTRYTPSKLMVSLRAAGGSFGDAVEPVPGVVAGELRLGVACDGSVTLLWSDANGVWISSHVGTGGTGACDGQPGVGPWSPPRLLSQGRSGTALPDLAVNDAGAALAVWQEGAAGNPSAIGAAVREAGADWAPAQTISAATGRATWNPKPGLDAAGNAGVGFLDGNTMVVVTRPAAGAWGTPVPVSGTQAAYYPAFAVSAQGDMLASWLALDLSNIGSIWSVTAAGGGPWTAPVRLSARSESADWPTAAYAGDGSVALVGWTDNATNTVRASVLAIGGWSRRRLGTGYWGGQVPVAAGGGAAVAVWATTSGGNPNAGLLVARSWQ
ncbi:MAG: hypothetical protein OEU93_16395 [Rubrivivax sp.]|nr:hypothetical protein [Rubrivivax sp.]